MLNARPPVTRLPMARVPLVRARWALRLTALASFLAPLPALAAVGDWVEGQHVRMRLVATHASPEAPLEAAIEIELDPGWKTYWRSPGDAGIPPRLDFSASDNAVDARVEFPAPERDDDGFSVSNVYHDRVALPVRFAAGDPARAARLQLQADLGVCNDICLPVSLALALDVPAADRDGDAAAVIDAARDALPRPGEPGTFEIARLSRVGGPDTAPEFEAEVVTAASTGSVLFVETPSDWYAAAPARAASGEGRATYRFSVDRKTAAGPLAGATVRLTLATPDGATTRAFTLAASGPATPVP